MNIRILVLQFCEYSLYIKGYSKATTLRYRIVVNFFCRQAGISNIEEINKDNVRLFFFNGRMNRAWGANTFVQYHKTLAVFFRWCIKEKYMESDPTLDVEVPKVPKRMRSKCSRSFRRRTIQVHC